MIHELKILPSFYAPILSGDKTFEIRKNDRDFKVGDTLILKEWDGEGFTGSAVSVQVTYLTDYAQRKGYVVMAITNWLK